MSSYNFMTSIRANAVKVAVSRLHDARLELAKGHTGVADVMIEQALGWLERGLDIGPSAVAVEEAMAGLDEPASASESPL